MIISEKSYIYIDYYGRLPIEDDPSDYIKPIKAVRLA